jgi:hypothetical protein
MMFVDAKIGDRILVYLNSHGNLSIGQSGESTQIPATVLDQTGGGTTLGWKKGEAVPRETSLFFDIPLWEHWKQDGFVQVYHYGSHCYCTPLDTITINAGPTEKPCKQCGRKNDLGVSKCWMCETVNPTA